MKTESPVTGANVKCCANCIFFDKFPIQNRVDSVLGACKANPPFPPPKADPYLEQEKQSKLGVWPLVLGNFWCGVFEQKENGK